MAEGSLLMCLGCEAVYRISSLILNKYSLAKVSILYVPFEHCLKIQFLLITGKLVQWVNMFAAKPGDQSLIPRACMVEGENRLPLSSNPNMYRMMAQTYAHPK